ncbi:MAG: PDZ domain-containing protein [Saprospiraceae bacterium]|nr:PDZ domain-containing protein [Saprospiraceae bacterium]
MKTWIWILALTFMANLAQAQEKKKVIVKKVEKTETATDGLGKTIITREISSDGDENKMTEVIMEDGKDGEYLTVTKENHNGEEVSLYTLVSVKGGEKKVIKWDGKGEIPAEIKKKMEDVEIREFDNGDEKTIIVEKREGKHMGGHKGMWVEDKEQNQPPKVKMGVMINDDNKGVYIDEVFKGSPADKGGMEKGDLILKINNTYIFSDDQLFETLRGLKEGDKANFVVVRQGKEKNLDLKF